jgi:hypothetical protein
MRIGVADRTYFEAGATEIVSTNTASHPWRCTRNRTGTAIPNVGARHLRVREPASAFYAADMTSVNGSTRTLAARRCLGMAAAARAPTPTTAAPTHVAGRRPSAKVAGLA